MLGLSMVVGLVAGMVLLFDSSAARDGVSPPSPWLFVMVSAIVIAVLLTAHRLSNKEDK